LFKRLSGNFYPKHGIKMEAVVAIQRKLLELTFVVWKNNTSYIPNYLAQAVNSKGRIKNKEGRLPRI